MVLGTKIDSVNVLYGACGDAEEIYRRDDYSDIADLNPRAAKALLSKELENASAVVAQCDRKGVGILTYDDPLFPSRLKALAAPPTVLYYKGTLRRLDDECVVGMVGTRSMTDYGRNVTYAFAKSLAAGNTVIVSGLAAGIDATAHKGALDAGGTASRYSALRSTGSIRWRIMSFSAKWKNGVLYSANIIPDAERPVRVFP